MGKLVEQMIFAMIVVIAVGILIGIGEAAYRSLVNLIMNIGG